jgi:hypothetical protein
MNILPVLHHWFLCLFVTVLPLDVRRPSSSLQRVTLCVLIVSYVQTVLHVWDSMYYEGPHVLFRVALALFKINEAALLGTSSQLAGRPAPSDALPRRITDAVACMRAQIRGTMPTAST